MNGFKSMARLAAPLTLGLMLTGCISVIGGRHHDSARGDGGLTVEAGREAVVHCSNGSAAGKLERTQGDWLIVREPSGAESWIRMSDVSRIDYR